MPRYLPLGMLLILAGCSGPESTNTPSEPVAGASEQRVYIDPETGKLAQPPSSEATRKSDRATASPPAYTREERPDGSTMLRPKEPERHVIEAERDSEGNLQVRERDRHAQ